MGRANLMDGRRANMYPDEWRGMYDGGWQGLIVPEAFAHPAKYGRNLISRIYRHCREQGWLKAGDSVVDPFGGVGLGALDAQLMGCHWTGCELEPRFVALAEQNLALWQRRFGHVPGWGTARVIQGDSRNLARLVDEASACVSSPPYAEMVNANGEGPGMAGNAAQRERIARGDRGEIAAQSANIGYCHSPGQLGATKEGSFSAAVSSPPYAETTIKDAQRRMRPNDGRPKPCSWDEMTADEQARVGYGHTDGQLGAMKEGSFSAAVASPPYAGSLEQSTDGIDWTKGKNGRDFSVEPGQAIRLHTGKNYGSQPGQLSAMREGSFSAAVSSPPYAESINSKGSGIDTSKMKFERSKSPGSVRGREVLAGNYGTTPGQLGRMPATGFDGAISSPPYEQAESGGPVPADKYPQVGGRIFGYRREHQGATDGQLGNETADDFWSAARVIVEQTYAVLKPGGHAVWVTKDYVRNRQRVPFSDNWQALCEAVGFKHVCSHRALFVVDNGQQLALDGKHISLVKSRKSFFRRLCESKGSPKIDWEDVRCYVKT